MTVTGPLVLLVEDEPQMRRFLRTALPAHGFRLLEAGSLREARLLATSHRPDVILLDLGLPDGDGHALLAELRGWTSVPVLVLSARGQEEDKVRALDAGADDYLTKPFGVPELLARIRVAMRHAARADSQPEPVHEIGALRVDLAAHEVRLDGQPVRLTPTEFRLLAVLARHAGKVLTQRQLLREVWGAGWAGDPHVLRVYMGQLRRKLEADPARPRYLQTEPGIGYRLREPDALS